MFGLGKSQSTSISEADVIAALSTVNDPELHRDLVSLGMIRDIAIDGGRVAFTVVLTTPACPLKNVIQQDCENALKRDIPAVETVHVQWDAQVPRDSRLSSRVAVPVRNAIAVGSGKGGVGKSTVAVNLAVSLAQQGATVGLLDADVYGPNVPMMMGQRKARPVSKDGKHIEPIEAYGVKMISIGFLVDEQTPLVWRGPMLHGALRQFLGDVNWGDLDYLIIDLPPGTGDVQLSLTQAMPLTGAVIVSTPQAVSQHDVVKSIAMFQLEQIDVPVLGVIENMSGFAAPDTGTVYDIFGAGGGREVADQMKVPFLGTIPIDMAVRQGGDSGVPIVVGAPDSPAARAITQIAAELAGRISVLTLSRPKERTFAADPDLAFVG
ncbi:MAG: Mrp/NBP35 family ATP-binding protein [Ardenticatenales bacterium]|nr:Mrp/NBP35 family ATP-binding protein [Ardenticatenales bacterium]